MSLPVHMTDAAKDAITASAASISVIGWLADLNVVLVTISALIGIAVGSTRLWDWFKARQSE